MKELIKDLEELWEKVGYYGDHADVDKMILYLKDVEATAKLISANAEKARIDIEIGRY